MNDIPSNREKMEVWINDGDWVDPEDVIYVAPDYLMAFEMYKKEYENREIDDDPQCVCGVYRSEHILLGCPEGFQTPAQWEAERQRIIQSVWDEEE